MTDDAIRQAAEAVRPSVEPYAPFPRFVEWLAKPFDPSGVDRFIGQLRQLQNETEQPALDDAVAIATRWAAINTGAIEGLYEVDRGFTYSVAVSSAAWNAIEQVKGQFAASSIADAMRAYELVLDAATDQHPITQVWIRNLHETVTASQDTYTVITEIGQQEQPLPKGKYKRYPNNPLNFSTNVVHSYAPPVDTQAEMARFIDEISGKEFAQAHAVVQAAYAHYAFVCIHPFADGNGRVSRALASTFLYRGIGIPLVVFADQKGDYLDCLELADRGDPTRFVRFVAERVSDTIGMVREQVRAAAVPPVESQMETLAPMLTGLGGLTHGEIDALVQRLREAFGAALSKQKTETPLAPPLVASVFTTHASSQPPASYRIIPGDPYGISLRIEGQPPAPVSVERSYTSATRRPNHDGADFSIFCNSAEIISADLRELHPVITQAFQFRLEAAAQRELRALTSEATRAALKMLKQSGYL